MSTASNKQRKGLAKKIKTIGAAINMPMKFLINIRSYKI